MSSYQKFVYFFIHTEHIASQRDTRREAPDLSSMRVSGPLRHLLVDGINLLRNLVEGFHEPVVALLLRRLELVPFVVCFLVQKRTAKQDLS